ncbi:hypothetical protein [Streptomyces sp. NBC_00280]|uniref:hypothetical protein n=1 Tax=Streptomyces sp. NBC_00280 TaxID=2975699 RepID=UPI0032518541
MDLEDAHKAARHAVVATPDIDRRVPEPKRLEAALEEAVEGVAAVARRHGITSESKRLDGDR